MARSLRRPCLGGRRVYKERAKNSPGLFPFGGKLLLLCSIITIRIVSTSTYYRSAIHLLAIMLSSDACDYPQAWTASRLPRSLSAVAPIYRSIYRTCPSLTSRLSLLHPRWVQAAHHHSSIPVMEPLTKVSLQVNCVSVNIATIDQIIVRVLTNRPHARLRPVRHMPRAIRAAALAAGQSVGSSLVETADLCDQNAPGQ